MFNQVCLISEWVDFVMSMMHMQDHSKYFHAGCSKIIKLKPLGIKQGLASPAQQ